MFGGSLWIWLQTIRKLGIDRFLWRISVPDSIDSDIGIYFLRTNVDSLDEKTTWDYYNLTREIECTNRQLKTDLSLRPIYHRCDGRSDAYPFIGLLSY